MMQDQTTARDPTRHTVIEDAVGLATGVVLASVGVHFLSHAGLVTGQTAGVAVLLGYATGYGFGPMFFLVNLPFYALALLRMGWVFTLRTLLAVSAVSALTPLGPVLLPLGALDPLTAALAASVLVGVGLLALFRHRASLGGVGILAVYLQERIGVQAGWTQLAVDAVVFGAALLLIAPSLVLVSFVGAAALNVLLALNHRSDRYIGR